MSRIENTVPCLLVSLFSVDGNEPTTGAEIIEANEGCDTTIEALNIALRDGHCEAGANGADVELITLVTDRWDSDIIKAAESLKTGWDCIDEIDDEGVSGPHCDNNYVWRVINGHAYLVFDMNGLCGIRADYLVSELACH
jgi:hypothetical protein